MAFSLSNWLLGVLSYLVCHLIHVVWWHRKKPEREVLWLAALFFLAPAAALFQWGGAALLIHFWLSAQYLAVYPAFQASSPTLHLLAALRAAGPKGKSARELESSAAGLDRHDQRREFLNKSGLLRGETLSFSGRLTARAFLTYRAWLRLPEGEG
jgi:hypothetical protein